LAVICDDFQIRVYDIEVPRLVRKFSGHTNRLTDLCFSCDGRWLISSAFDKTIRVWDIPSSQLYYWFKVTRAVTSLSLNDSGSFLATTHLGVLGTFLWTNMAYYSNLNLKNMLPLGSLAQVPDFFSDLQQNNSKSLLNEASTSKKKLLIHNPTHQKQLTTGNTKAEEEENRYEQAKDEEMEESQEREEQEEEEVKDEVKEEMDEVEETIEEEETNKTDLISFSNVPRPTWLSLTNLDTIRERNKPKDPPKKPPNAPFFLTSEATSNSSLFVEESANGGDQLFSPPTSKLKVGFSHICTPFSKSLREAYQTNNYEEVIKQMTSQSVTQLDLNIRMLNIIEEVPENFDESDDLLFFLNFIEKGISSQKNFEISNALLNLFLQLHGSSLANRKDLNPIVVKLLHSTQKSWSSLGALFQNSLCLLNFFTGVQT